MLILNIISFPLHPDDVLHEIFTLETFPDPFRVRLSEISKQNQPNYLKKGQKRIKKQQILSQSLFYIQLVSGQMDFRLLILAVVLCVTVKSFQEAEQFDQLSQIQSDEDGLDHFGQKQRVYESSVKSISMRLTPNQDIMTQITQLLNQAYHKNKLKALSIVSAVGSVNYCWLRLANQSTLTKIKGPMEIVSLQGTFDLNLQPHLHISISKATGQTIGGHLPSIQQRQQTIKSIQNTQQTKKQGQFKGVPFDCPIFTTLQLVLLSHQNLVYQRKIDPETTFHELTIRKKHLFQK